MNCEQFLFEASYLLESGECGHLPSGVSRHLHQCSSCHARFHQLKQQSQSTKMAELAPLVSQRLHQTIDLLIGQRRPSPKMWLQMACTCLILVGSIVGIAYQSHPTATPPVFARR
jgi:hypothetical protein